MNWSDECIFVRNSGNLDEAIYEPEDLESHESQGLSQLAQEAMKVMAQDSSELYIAADRGHEGSTAAQDKKSKN